MWRTTAVLCLGLCACRDNVTPALEEWTDQAKHWERKVIDLHADVVELLQDVPDTAALDPRDTASSMARRFGDELRRTDEQLKAAHELLVLNDARVHQAAIKRRTRKLEPVIDAARAELAPLVSHVEGEVRRRHLEAKELEAQVQREIDAAREADADGDDPDDGRWELPQ